MEFVCFSNRRNNDLYVFYLFLIVGTDVLGGPMSHRSQNAHPSIAKKRDLREPSLVREGGDHGAKRS